MTVWEHLHWAGARLPMREGALLLGDLLGKSSHELWMSPGAEVPPHVTIPFRQKVRSRQAGEPLAYLRGRAYFWDMELKVSPAVLCPRPETEHLVEAALAQREEGGLLVADGGTGSGAVAIALKRERPDWHVVATDLSRQALLVARDNIRSCGVEVRTFFGDLLSPLLKRGLRPDMILMNPPYVAPAERVDVEVHREPPGAIWGGPDGLAVTRRLADQAASLLPPGGSLLVEIGAGKESRVSRVVRERMRVSEEKAILDLSGLIRILVFKKA